MYTRVRAGQSCIIEFIFVYTRTCVYRKTRGIGGWRIWIFNSSNFLTRPTRSICLRAKSLKARARNLSFLPREPLVRRQWFSIRTCCSNEIDFGLVGDEAVANFPTSFISNCDYSCTILLSKICVKPPWHCVCHFNNTEIECSHKL